MTKMNTVAHPKPTSVCIYQPSFSPVYCTCAELGALWVFFTTFPKNVFLFILEGAEQLSHLFKATQFVRSSTWITTQVWTQRLFCFLNHIWNFTPYEISCHCYRKLKWVGGGGGSDNNPSLIWGNHFTSGILPKLLFQIQPIKFYHFSFFFYEWRGRLSEPTNDSKVV